ncbi:MAG TPA: mandelate racemase/muconate lactonizing enzyme family protein [Chloroflexota bacterium]|jgi:L-alanine-DL-glutamate epimerase-like enolase superfamily enzyme
MRVMAVETIHADAFPPLCYLRVHTDEGLVGLGETFWGPAAVAAHVHEALAPHLLGEDPLLIERHRQRLALRGLRDLGAEGRALSALDLALWDLLGQATGRPIHALLGGAVRERVRVYNTCAGYEPSDWRVGGPTEGPYEDRRATFERPEELAESLLAEGITAMKIWPFETGEGGRSYVAPEDLARGLEPLRRIRRAVGDRIDVLLDCGRWSLPLATRIARAVEEYEPFWLEDPLPPDEPAAWRELAASTRVPLAGGEELGGRGAFRALLEHGLQVALFDPGWVGGISEGRVVAALADAYRRPFCPHDCTGPVSFVAGVHLSISAPNAMLQEYVRAYYAGAYRELVTELPRVEGGYVYAPTAPGLGTALRPDFVERSGAHVRVSRLS